MSRNLLQRLKAHQTREIMPNLGKPTEISLNLTGPGKIYKIQQKPSESRLQRLRNRLQPRKHVFKTVRNICSLLTDAALEVLQGGASKPYHKSIIIRKEDL